MPFAQGFVDVRSIGDEEWQLLAQVGYEGKVDSFEVPAGTETDFASVPRVFVWLLPRYGKYTQAAILHDYLWRVAVPDGQLTLPEADGIFRRAMRELGVPFLRRWMMWSAVRLGALVKPGGRKRWIQESWRVVPIAIVSLLIVLPPAILILVALGVFYLVELLLYLPLRVTTAIKARGGQEVPKQVNAPTLDLESS